MGIKEVVLAARSENDRLRRDQRLLREELTRHRSALLAVHRCQRHCCDVCTTVVEDVLKGLPHE